MEVNPETITKDTATIAKTTKKLLLFTITRSLPEKGIGI
jgi:hypothetical protein